MSKKRPAASSVASLEAEISALRRENAKLKKENAALRGEDTKKKPPAARHPEEAYVTGLLAGQEYSICYQMEGFEKNFGRDLYATLKESIRDGKEIELTMKGGKKVDLNKTFQQNGIEPNSYVYVRYTGPAPWEKRKR